MSRGVRFRRISHRSGSGSRGLWRARTLKQGSLNMFFFRMPQTRGQLFGVHLEFRMKSQRNCLNLKWVRLKKKFIKWLGQNCAESKSLGTIHSWNTMCVGTADAAAKSLQSCPTLCDLIDGSSPGSPVPGILEALLLLLLSRFSRVQALVNCKRHFEKHHMLTNWKLDFLGESVLVLLGNGGRV